MRLDGVRGAAYARTMSEGQQQLAAIAEQVARGEEPRETVRALLGWFGYMRRGATVVREIRRTLSRLDLQTVPDFAYEYIDAPIRFVAISKTVSPEDEAEDSSPAQIPEAAPAHGPRQELAYKVGRLGAANKQRLVTVNPDDTLEKAVTVMLSENIDQLIVARTERDPRGILTWRGIASKLVLGGAMEKVRDCMEDAVVVRKSDSLFDVDRTIARDGAVIVRSKEAKILGIVTSADVSEEFGRLAKPFLLLGEIERHLRALVEPKLTLDDLRAPLAQENGYREVNHVNDLTLGDFKRVLEKPERWNKLGLRVDRETFIAKLDEVRRVRNETMHFYPEDADKADSGDIDKLRSFSAFLQRLEMAQRSTV